MKQSGDGCDYMIGCAQKLVELEAKNIKEAKNEALKIFKKHGFWVDEEDYYGRDGLRDEERLLEKAIIFSDGVEIDVESHYKQLEEIVAAAKKVEQQKKERKELQRLQKKYDKH
jgi:hypothetical protein